VVGRAALCIALMVTLACGTVKQVVPATSPSPPMVSGPTLSAGAMAFDVSDGELVLLDPSEGVTWTWDGLHSWKLRHPSSVPTEHSVKIGGPIPAMAWDPATSSVLAIVGDTPVRPGVSFPDQVVPATWSWHAGEWSKLAVHTPNYIEGAMGSFPPKHQVILFSGCCDFSQPPPLCCGGGPGPVAERAMWAWNGTDWAELHPAHMPPPRFGGSMIYDPAFGKLVLFGGVGGGGPNPMADLWTWDGADWTQATPAKIDINLSASAASSPAGGLVVAAGFYPSTKPLPGPLAETWTWDGVAWRKLDVPTPNCFVCELAYDPVRKFTVMVTTMVTNTEGATHVANQVWTWDGKVWTQRS